MRFRRTFISISILIGLTLAAPSSADKKDISVPAVFSQYLALPGKMNRVKDPGRLVFEPAAKELYVADIGNARVLIFDSNNVFRFQFSTRETVGSPVDLAASRDGFVYALGHKDGRQRLGKFDYDGTFLGIIPLPDTLVQGGSETNSMAAGEDGRLYLFNEYLHTVTVIDTAGAVLSRFSVCDQLKDKERREMVYGSLYMKDTLLYLPLSGAGTIFVYTRGGVFVRSVGRNGSATGELNFPVSVAVGGNGIVYVLDKSRFNVSCYSPQGKFLGEFGGMGDNPGWFYFPHTLAVNFKNQIVIGQVFNGFIQVCDPPAFLADLDTLARK